MNNHAHDKDAYRQFVHDYFRAFETHDFSRVKFSSRIRFLSPISGVTMDGREAVRNFVSGVSTRVTAVEIVAICVDYPHASGVWKMTTSHGTVYTLHNYFELDDEGLAYIWPMFDPKAVMNDPRALLSWLRGNDYYDVAGVCSGQPTGVAVSRAGRIFVCFPWMTVQQLPAVAEILPDGSLLPFPNAPINDWDRCALTARDRFVCVHTVYIDQSDSLWILDPASPAHKGVVDGGAKLLRVNLTTNIIQRIYHFGYDVAPFGSYLNKLRIAQGHAFITDSDLGALLVLNLETGKTRRVLADHFSAKSEAGVGVIVENQTYGFPPVHADGIGVDPRFEHVYYKALTGKAVYRVAVAALIDETLSAAELGARVEKVADTEPTGGIEFDARGNLYLTAFGESAIKALRPDGRIDFIARSTDFQWPDTIAISHDGSELLFSASQLHLSPQYNGGVDKRNPPYKIFRIKLS